MTNNKKTKEQMFREILADLTKPDQIETIEHEIELLEKKRASRSEDRRLAEVNNILADNLYNFMVENTYYRASHFINRVEGITNTSKATAILMLLCHSGKVQRIEEKSTPYFVKSVVYDE